MADVPRMAGLDLRLDARFDDAEERARVAGFLGGGVAIAVGVSRDEDRLDPERGSVVPRAFVTDGTWIWSLALEYYVKEHGVVPEPDFYAHIREGGYTAATPEDAARDRAGEYLDASLDGDGVSPEA